MFVDRSGRRRRLLVLGGAAGAVLLAGAAGALVLAATGVAGGGLPELPTVPQRAHIVTSNHTPTTSPSATGPGITPEPGPAGTTAPSPAPSVPATSPSAPATGKPRPSNTHRHTPSHPAK